MAIIPFGLNPRITVVKKKENTSIQMCNSITGEEEWQVKMLSGGHGEVNPNSSWHSSRGAWLSYLAGVLALHLFLLSIPILSIPTAWTLTNVIHNLVSVCENIWSNGLKMISLQL